MKKIDMLLFYSPCRTHTVVAQFGRLVRRVPALQDHFEFFRLISRATTLKPLRFYHSASQRRGRLEVLRGKIVFAQGFAKTIEYLKWLSFRMKSFASTTLKTVKSI